MSTIDCHPQKYEGPTRDALQQLDRPNCLGTDAQGATHHHSPYDARVVVVDERGDIERTVDLSDRQLSTWLAYVDEKRGWENLNYRESFGQIVVEALQ